MLFVFITFFLCFIGFCHVSEFHSYWYFFALHNEKTQIRTNQISNICLLFRVYRLLSSRLLLSELLLNDTINRADEMSKITHLTHTPSFHQILLLHSVQYFTIEFILTLTIDTQDHHENVNFWWQKQLILTTYDDNTLNTQQAPIWLTNEIPFELENCCWMIFCTQQNRFAIKWPTISH